MQAPSSKNLHGVRNLNIQIAEQKPTEEMLFRRQLMLKRNSRLQAHLQLYGMQAPKLGTKREHLCARSLIPCWWWCCWCGGRWASDQWRRWRWRASWWAEWWWPPGAVALVAAQRRLAAALRWCVCLLKFYSPCAGCHGSCQRRQSANRTLVQEDLLNVVCCSMMFISRVLC